MIKISFRLSLIFSVVLTLTVLNVDIKAADISDFKVPSDFKFTKNLYFGQKIKPDVSYLQNILNMSIDTQVATGSDSGSNKNLTNFYGKKTKIAVEKFQTIFAKDIKYEFDLANSSSTTKTLFNINSDDIDSYTMNVLNKLIALYVTKRNISTSSNPVVGTNIKNNLSEDVVRFDIQQEQRRSTDISPTGVDKNIFAHSPEGQLVKLIGGYALLDKVYNYTPSGFTNNTINGSINGQGLKGGVSAISASVGASAVSGLSGSSGLTGSVNQTMLQPFGGKTTNMVICTCSANILLYIQDTKGSTLQLIYQPGLTQLYELYNPRTGVNVLGNYTSGGQCLVYEGSSCSTRGSPNGTMTQLGTSLSTGGF